MANFHSNCLAVAADEGNMCKVLFRMAMNLAANGDETGFEMGDAEGLDSARELYRVVGPAVDAHYPYAFAGAPVPDCPEAASALGWTAQAGPEGGLLEQLAAMVRSTERMAEGDDVRLVATAPVGRPASDTASVSLARHGSRWLLAVSYCTAWEPNYEDLDAFFLGLPQGEYGVAFLDADEHDDYESVSALSGLHRGLSGMDDLEGGEQGVFGADELRELRRDWRRRPKAEVESLPGLARAGAICAWSELGWDDEEEDGDDEFTAGQ